MLIWCDAVKVSMSMIIITILYLIDASCLEMNVLAFQCWLYLGVVQLEKLLAAVHSRCQ